MIQSAVNFSTSDINLVERIVEEIKEYATVCDYSADIDHNRSVITILGDRKEVFKALKVCGKFAGEIDLRKHKGAHPRMGSLDVVPVVPLRDESMETCIKLAYKVGKMLWRDYQIPIFFYEEACIREENRCLEDVRSSEYKTLDYGTKPHEKMGATCVGARYPLIAYNVNLETDNVKIAKIIAKEIRDMRKKGDPRMYGVKAMGLYLEKQNIVQVTTNITRPQMVGPFEVYSYIEKRAKDLGTDVRESELIGEIPLETASDIVQKALKFKNFSPKRII